MGRLAAWVLGVASALTLVLLALAGSDATSSYGEVSPPPDRATAASSTTVRPSGSAPTNPIAYKADTIFTLGDRVGTTKGGYYIVVPKSYDRSNRTPTSLLVWLHGCQTSSKYEIFTPSPAVRDGTPTQRWISIAPTGREYVEGKNDGCWRPGQDEDIVLAAIRNVESHFNIDPRRIVIGGFSSGGDLAYRTIFDFSDMFAGILAENTLPFRDTGRTQSQLLHEAAWKFHIVHVAHKQDDQYPIGQVRQETAALKRAGFPIKVIERRGEHSEPDHGTYGSGHDIDVFLIPHMYDGWLAPAQ